ncbi:MAG: alpha amylase C-terminal domain-containing protein [Candidatus Competibacter sp.]
MVIIVYLRRDNNQRIVLIILNFAAIARNGYQVGVPLLGTYREVLNSNAVQYCGDGGVVGDICALPVYHMGQPYSLLMDLPPLTGVVLVLDVDYPS